MARELFSLWTSLRVDEEDCMEDYKEELEESDRMGSASRRFNSSSRTDKNKVEESPQGKKSSRKINAFIAEKPPSRNESSKEEAKDRRRSLELQSAPSRTRKSNESKTENSLNEEAPQKKQGKAAETRKAGDATTANGDKGGKSKKRSELGDLNHESCDVVIICDKEKGGGPKKRSELEDRHESGSIDKKKRGTPKISEVEALLASGYIDVVSDRASRLERKATIFVDEEKKKDAATRSKQRGADIKSDKKSQLNPKVDTSTEEPIVRKAKPAKKIAEIKPQVIEESDQEANVERAMEVTASELERTGLGACEISSESGAKEGDTTAGEMVICPNLSASLKDEVRISSPVSAAANSRRKKKRKRKKSALNGTDDAAGDVIESTIRESEPVFDNEIIYLTTDVTPIIDEGVSKILTADGLSSDIAEIFDSSCLMNLSAYCNYEWCSTPFESLQPKIAAGLSAGGRDWCPFVGMIFCASCFTRFRDTGSFRINITVDVSTEKVVAAEKAPPKKRNRAL